LFTAIGPMIDPFARIIDAQLRQRVDRYARLHFIEEMRPGIGKADDIARIDSEDGRQVGVEHAEPHCLLR
jgi:hypothetical protein